jgi:hypothetical protein
LALIALTLSICFNKIILQIAQHYKILILPTERGKARRPIFRDEAGPKRMPNRAVSVAKRTIDLETVMNGISLRSRRILSARRIALLTTAITGIGTAAFMLAPNIVANPLSDRRKHRI